MHGRDNSYLRADMKSGVTMCSLKRSGSRTSLIGILRWAGYLVLLAIVAGCASPEPTPDPIAEKLNLSHEGQHTSGDWTYAYSITSAGTRSEGYHGTLSYRQTELPAPLHVNDYYETPWGPLYWVGEPVVAFGAHGWMPTPLAREPIGQALIDPAIAHSERFMVHLKIVTSEPLYTPDRMEQDPAVLAALKPFGLSEVHTQVDWFPVGSDPITLHDTKRWGTLKVCRSDLHERPAPTLEFTCTTDLTVDTSPKPVTLAELMPAPEFLGKPSRISLSPQVDTLQPIQCTLSPIVGDPLVLYLVCRIEDQGPTPPWTVPAIRVWEAEPSDSGTVDPVP